MDGRDSSIGTEPLPHTFLADRRARRSDCVRHRIYNGGWVQYCPSGCYRTPVVRGLDPSSRLSN